MIDDPRLKSRWSLEGSGNLYEYSYSTSMVPVPNFEAGGKTD